MIFSSSGDIFHVIALPTSFLSYNESISNHVSTDLSSKPPGILQIPYTGIITDNPGPEVAQALGLNRSSGGLIVTEVIPGSPADEAGLRGGNVTKSVAGEIVRLGGDIILMVDANATYVKSDTSFPNYLSNDKKVGDSLTLNVLRDGIQKEVNLTIRSLPEYFWYENPDERIKIKYPSDWEVSERNLGMTDIVKFFSPEQNPSEGVSTAGVFVKVFWSVDDSLENLANAERIRSNSTRNLDIEFTSLSGFPAYESRFYSYEDEDRTLKMLSIFTIDEGRKYRINYAADPSKYDEYLPQVKEMIKSFQIVD